MTNHLVGVTEIAELLGVSRQRVAQLMETYPDFPKPEVELTAGRIWSRTAIETWTAMHPERRRGEAAGSGGLFERFTAEARRSIVLAQEEARELRHSYIGTEHLLLGLVAENDGIAARALASVGVDPAAVRELVVEMTGRGKHDPDAQFPFTPRAKVVLELAGSEASMLGHDSISTEHVLLALLTEGDGAAAQLLVKRGLRLDRVRAKVRELMRAQGASVTPNPTVEAMRLELEPIRKLLHGIDRRLSALESRSAGGASVQ